MNHVNYSQNFVIPSQLTIAIFVYRIWTLNFYNVLKLMIMGNLLYIIAVILVIGWLIGFIGYGAGGIIHILLVIAIIAVLLNIIQGRRSI